MKQLATALVAAQAELHNLSKDAEGYGYKYLTLGKLIAETRPILAKHKLAIIQPLGNVDGQPAVITMIIHESGEMISEAYPITKAGMKQVNDSQQMGAAVTYARRYGLASILNIAQEDDDAACLTQNAGNKQYNTSANDDLF